VNDWRNDLFLLGCFAARTAAACEWSLWRHERWRLSSDTTRSLDRGTTGKITLSVVVTGAYRVSTRSSKRPALHLLEVCWTFAGSCKQHPISDVTLTTLDLRCAQGDVTELNWHSLDFDELTSGQAVMHYSRHRLTGSLAYVTTLTYASTNDQFSRPTCSLVSSSKTKPCQFGSVQFSYVALYAPLRSGFKMPRVRRLVGPLSSVNISMDG